MNVAPKSNVNHTTASAGALRPDERQAVRREALLRAIAIVQRYQDEHWRRLRVNDICTDLKRLLRDEAGR
jgi:hypothetical protein